MLSTSANTLRTEPPKTADLVALPILALAGVSRKQRSLGIARAIRAPPIVSVTGAVTYPASGSAPSPGILTEPRPPLLIEKEHATRVPPPVVMFAVAALAVVTDSTHYLPRDLLESAGVEQVSLHVGFGDELRLETDISDLEAFYASLRTSKTMPRTSQPSVGEFIARYEPLLSQGRDVVSVHLAAGISGTCASALAASRLLARRGFPGRVEVVDSRSGAAGLGCLVLVAADAARAGLPIDQVVAKVDRARDGLDMWFCLDTLKYLRRGGRIGGAQAWAGSALRIKPILTFGTEITPVARVRTRRRAFERMVEYLQQLSDRGATDWVVQHIQAPEEADQLVLRGTQIFGAPPLFRSQVGPVLGAHLGPGMIGVAGLAR